MLGIGLRQYFSNVSKLLVRIVQYGCISHCILEHGADLVVCSGPSMEPTISTNDIVISEHISSKLCRFNYGDIVIARSPSDPRYFICKRITALPGDHVKTIFGAQSVPRGHVWLEGDNQINSSDSREYGPVPQGLIKGRVLCKVWPFKDITMLTVKSS